MEVSTSLADLIRRYISLLLVWNEKVSLTSIRAPQEILKRHFGESMFASHAVPIRSGRLADVGSGAGFPGLALKLVCPELEVFLIEPNGKKAAFLAEVKRSLGLSGVEIWRGRLAEFRFSLSGLDWLTARAVGHFEALLREFRPLVAENGQVVLWLGESEARRLCRFPRWSWREPMEVPQSLRRVLLVGKPTGT